MTEKLLLMLNAEEVFLWKDPVISRSDEVFDKMAILSFELLE